MHRAVPDQIEFDSRCNRFPDERGPRCRVRGVVHRDETGCYGWEGVKDEEGSQGSDRFLLECSCITFDDKRNRENQMPGAQKE